MRLGGEYVGGTMTPARTYAETYLKPLQFWAKTQFSDKFQGVPCLIALYLSFSLPAAAGGTRKIAEELRYF
jgi:hypothetical protein